MAKRFSIAGTFVSLSLSVSTTWAQSPPVPTVPAPGRMEAAGGPAITPNGAPYQLNPGQYVWPGPDTPDYWSPHLRPIPDYSTERSPFSSPLRPSITPFHQSARSPSCGAPVYGCGPVFAGPDSYAYAAPYYGDTDAAYEQGRFDADREYNWFLASQRAGRLLNQHAAMFDEGMTEFRQGNYEQAVVNWLGAAESNHANAACRLHAGHAMFALGRYREGVEHIARAHELSPSLAYKTFDIRDEYGNPADFDAHRAALRQFVAENPSDAAGMTLLGYVTLHTRGPGAALPILERAAQLDRKSFFVPRLLNLARQASPTVKQNRTTPATRSKTRTKPTTRHRGGAAPAWGV